LTILRSGYILARVAFEIVLAPEAVEDLRSLTANARARVRSALERHRRNDPKKTSRSSIKRLRGIARPQYRLRVGEVRVFYDVSGSTVEALAIVASRRLIYGWHDTQVANEAGSALRTQERPLALSARSREARIIITRHGKPAGVLIGFQSEDDWFEYRLENDPRFLQRIERARQNLKAGRGVKIEDVNETQ
jgi:mRNA interferase RelE/StbE